MGGACTFLLPSDGIADSAHEFRAILKSRLIKLVRTWLCQLVHNPSEVGLT